MDDGVGIAGRCSRRPGQAQRLQLLEQSVDDSHAVLEQTSQLVVRSHGGPPFVTSNDQAHRRTAQRRPAQLTELKTLGRTLNRRAADVLAYFTRPGTSNGPTKAIYGRLEHLRGSALGFRNLTNYIARSQLETGGLEPRLHPQL